MKVFKRKTRGFVWLILTVFVFETGPLAAPAWSADSASGSDIHGGMNMGSPNPGMAPGNPEPGREDRGDSAPPKGAEQCGGPKSDTDPVAYATGEFILEETDMVFPSRGMDIEIKRTYLSQRAYNGRLGYGWFLSYDFKLQRLSSGNMLLVDGEKGRKNEFTAVGVDGMGHTLYDSEAGEYEELIDNGDGTHTLVKRFGKRYTFDIDGKLTSIADRNGNSISLTYDVAGKLPILAPSLYIPGQANGVIALDYKLMKITDTVGREIDLVYDANGRLETITDSTGRVWSYHYTDDDLTSVDYPPTAQYPAGTTRQYTYDAGHNLEDMIDARGQTYVTNLYDSQDRVYAHTWGDGTTTISYDEPNKLTTVTDRKGFVTEYSYNDNGAITQEKRYTQTPKFRPTDPDFYLTVYTLSDESEKIEEIFPKGNGIKRVYDRTASGPCNRGNLLEFRRKADMSAPDDNLNDLVTAMTYEPQFNQMKTLTDPKGSIYTYTFDYELLPADPNYGTAGNIVQIDMPAVTAGTPQVNFEYNAFGQVTRVTDPNGNEVTYDYFPATGYLKDVFQDPSGVNAHTAFTYDVYGNLDTVTDANNHVTDLDFNELGWLVKVTNPLTYVTDYSHDENGNVRFIRRQADDPRVPANDQVTEFTYDVLNNVKTITDPLSRVTTFNYDANENLESIQDADATVLLDTQYVYDERDLLYTVTDAQAGVTTYDYDVNGNLANINDAENNDTAYTYDNFDRLDITTYANSTTQNNDYDKNSNLDFVTLPDTNTIDYVYDELNRLKNKNFPNNTSRNITYEYDLGSRLKVADNASSEIDFNYDALNRLDDVTQRINSTNYTIDYAYEDNGNLSQIIYTSTKTVDYTYDGLNRLDLVKVGGTNLVDYDYDPLDRRDTKTFTNLSPQQQTDYTFDLANQLTSLTNTVLPSTNISTYAYPQYDDVGNRKQYDRTYQTDPLETINYFYNNIYELTSVTGTQTHSYDYDLVGNREVADSITYTPNNLNQYSDVGGTTYAYDDNGNLTYDGTNTYTYDELNRLTTFTDGGTSASYEYDAFNRRTSKTVGAVTTYFVYDNDSVIAEYDSSGALNAEYVLGGEIDEVLLMTRSATDYYYHYDGLGSVTEITDNTGSVVENYTYDPYGNVVGTRTIGNPYYFTGRRLDDESDLYHYRARTYSSQLGRFLQRDPIGYVDGFNLYEYVDNNPINNTDPTGEIAPLVFAVGSAIVIGGVTYLIVKAFDDNMKRMEQLRKRQNEDLRSLNPDADLRALSRQRERVERDIKELLIAEQGLDIMNKTSGEGEMMLMIMDELNPNNNTTCPAGGNNGNQ